MKTGVAIVVFALTATSAIAANFPSWMAGSWRVKNAKEAVEEHWTAPDGGVMLGMSKTVRANGKTAFEFLRVAEVDGRLAYLAMPGARPTTAFPLRTLEASRVVFENLEHDFPQRIIYWRNGEQLCARTEGMIGGRLEGEEWCYERAVPARPLFAMQSNFWVNLHHFVRGVARGLPISANMTAEEKESWDKTVQVYRDRYAKRDLLLDDGMVAIKDVLRHVGNDDTPPELPGEPDLRETLVSIAPIYRKYWWPKHDASHRAWIAAAEPLVARYGQPLGTRIAAAYHAAWPQTAHPVDLSVQAGAVGAYTSWPPHSTITSTDPGYQGLASLELLFHEASHQWGRWLFEEINKDAERHQKKVPRQLWHAVLFRTSGELTRRVLAENGVEYTELAAGGIYKDLCGEGCRERVVAQWDKYLDGEISAEQALDRLVAAWP